MNNRIHTDLNISINISAGNGPFAGQPPVTLIQQITLVDEAGKTLSQTQVALPVIAADITEQRLADINAALASVGLVASHLS